MDWSKEERAKNYLTATSLGLHRKSDHHVLGQKLMPSLCMAHAAEDLRATVP
jgi:hypothetical protein